MNLLKKAWDEHIRRFSRVLYESATTVKLGPLAPVTPRRLAF